MQPAEPRASIAPVVSAVKPRRRDL